MSQLTDTLLRACLLPAFSRLPSSPSSPYFLLPSNTSFLCSLLRICCTRSVLGTRAHFCACARGRFYYLPPTTLPTYHHTPLHPSLPPFPLCFVHAVFSYATSPVLLLMSLISCMCLPCLRTSSPHPHTSFLHTLTFDRCDIWWLWWRW